MRIRPIQKSVRVPRPQAEAFRLFTEGIDSWWPLALHSIHGEHAERCVFEPYAEGRIYEVGPGGQEVTWGAVVAYEPHQRLLFNWHPGREARTAQEIEVRFEPDEAGTRVVLQHRGWDKLGDQSEAQRRRYDTGWDYVLGDCYAAAAKRG